jgi:predicted dehydrogenase
MYRDLDRFLAHPGLQGVVIVAPNPEHFRLVMAAFRTGLHVLVEKPLTNHVRQGADLVRQAATRQLVLAVGHNSRRSAHVRAMHRLLADGTLGRIVMAEGHFSHSGGLTLEPRSWRWSHDSCPGGPLNLLGIHEIDTVQSLLGPVDRVFGWQRRLAAPAEIPDTSATLLEFESGALGYIGSNYASPRARAVRLFGTGGNARWEGGDQLCLETADGQRRILRLEPVNTLGEQLADFTASIVEEGLPEVDGLTGLCNVAILEAAIESNRSEAPVAVREVFERADALDMLERFASK